MTIHSLSSKGSLIIKLNSLWPFIGFTFSLALALGTKSAILFFLAALFFYLFIYTLFYASYELYIDTEARKVVKKIKWLFINSFWEYSLTDYKFIYIALGGTVAKSNYGDRVQIRVYDVVLVHKWASSNSAVTWNIMENFLLDHMLKSPEEAKQSALKFSEILNVEVAIEKQVAKTHPDLLKYGKKF